MSDIDHESISVKIVILGDPAVGKTTLRQSFMGDRMEKDYQMTLGADIVITTIDVTKNISLEAQIWDLAGQESYIPTTRQFIKGTQGAILVFDLTRDYTFDKVSEWLDILHEENPQLDNNIPFIIVGNKADLENHIETNDERINEFVSFVNRHQKYSLTPAEYIKTSAKTGYKVEEAFSRLSTIILKNYQELGQLDIIEEALEGTGNNVEGELYDEASEDQQPKQELAQSSTINSSHDTEDEQMISDQDQSSLPIPEERSVPGDMVSTTSPTTSESTNNQLFSPLSIEEMTVPNPYDVVNVFIEVGDQMNLRGEEPNEIDLVSAIHSKIPLDTLLTSSFDKTGYELAVYENAVDVVKIEPNKYFKLTQNQVGEIGKWITIIDIGKLDRAYKIYQKYRDPRVRDRNLIQYENLYESILNVAHREYKQEKKRRIKIPLSKVSVPQEIKIDTIYDIPKLEWRRSPEDIELFSMSLITTILSQFKNGWMVNPDLIRLLNLVSEDILQEYLTTESILQQVQIITSIQRLGDIMYLSSFGDLTKINSKLQSDMYDKPLETRSNIPNFETKEIIDFLNRIKLLSSNLRNLCQVTRKIGICTKPLKDGTFDFVVVNSSSDAIRQILSVVHLAMDQDEMKTQIEIMYSLITDDNFERVLNYYFDPEYELLHSPLLSAMQSTIDRLGLYLQNTYYSEREFQQSHLDDISKVLDQLLENLESKPVNRDLVEIWQKVNNYLTSKITLDTNRPLNQKYDLIRGKEVILNIMTPLLLAKDEGRGFNPLAATQDPSLESQLKSRTGIIAIGSKLKSEQLKDLLDALFVEAPEMSRNPSSKSSTINTLPSPTGSKDPAEGSQLIPTPIGIGLARIANEYITGSGERNLYKALVDLINYTRDQLKSDSHLSI